MRKVIFVLAFAVVLIAVAACAPSAPAPAQQQQPQAQPQQPPAALPYRVGILSDLKTANYWSYQGANRSVWQAYVMGPSRLTLYTTDDKRFDLVPQVAVDLKADRVKDGDKWTITVKMKNDVKWSDGKPVTAKDVAFTTNTTVELELPSGYASVYDRAYYEKADAVDDYTVKYTFKKAPGLAVFESGAAQAAIMSEAYWAPVVAEAKKALQGVDKNNKDAWAKALKDAQQVLFNHVPQGEPLAGMFTFVKWEKGAYAENKANPGSFFVGVKKTVYKNGAYTESKAGYEYKQGDPTGDKLVEYTNGPTVNGAVYTLYGTQDAAVLALKKGEVDFLLNPLGLSTGLKDQVTNQKDIQVISNPTNGFRYLAFNFRKKPMSDLEFRQAMAYLIDKEFVTKTILQGVAFPIYTEVPEGNSFWHNPNVPKIGQGLSREERLAKAIELLKKAGYKWEGGKEPTWDKTALVVKPGGRLLMPDGTPMPELKLIAPSAGYDPLRSTFAIWVERWANEVGIPVRAELIGFNDLIERAYNDPNRDNFQMYILGWSLDLFPRSLNGFHNSRFSNLGDDNAGAYSNPEFDKLGDSLLDCQTFDDCKKIAFRLQEILATELPYIVLFDTGIIETYRINLKYPYTETLSGLQFTNGPNGFASAVAVSK